MCNFCRVPLRTECIINGAIIILILALLLGRVIYNGVYYTLFIVLIVSVCFGIIAAIFLILGASLKKRFLLWIWIVVIVPSTVVFVVADALILSKHWHLRRGFTNATNVILLLLLICFIAQSVYQSWKYIQELKEDEL